MTQWQDCTFEEAVAAGITKIPLSNSDRFAIVDSADAGLVNRWAWRVGERFGIMYARRNTTLAGGRDVTISMHRVILGAPPGVFVDHIDHDGLNNRRNNLRLSDPATNSMNMRKLERGTSSRFKGVSWHKCSRKWVSYITVTRFGKRRRFTLGSFSDEISAAIAYDNAARIHFGEFACVNFPKPGESSAIGLNGGPNV